MGIVETNDNDRESRLAELVDQHAKRLLNMCYMMLQDRTLAEDAVQETFLKAYRGLDAFRGESSDKTWLTRFAVNVCHDLRKSAWSRFVNRSVVPDDLPMAGPDAYSQEKLNLDMAILHLPDKYRKVILLRFYQELSVT